jgi:hypothetical protein
MFRVYGIFVAKHFLIDTHGDPEPGKEILNLCPAGSGTPAAYPPASARTAGSRHALAWKNTASADVSFGIWIQFGPCDRGDLKKIFSG